MDSYITSKRRRAYAWDDSSSVPTQPASFQPASQYINFTSLSAQDQQLLDHAASIYGISGDHLHQIVQSEHPSKRPRLGPVCSMSYQYRPDGFAPGEDHEKSSGLEHPGPDVSCFDSSSSQLPVAGFQHVTSGLSTLRQVLCAGCLTRLNTEAVTDYQALPGSEVYGYGVDRPYEPEKRPSTQLPGAEEYMPAVITTEPASSYVVGHVLPGDFMQGYQDTVDTSPTSPRNTKPDVDYFSPSVPVPESYPSHGTVATVSMAGVAHQHDTNRGHVMSDFTPLLSYTTPMLSIDAATSMHMATPLAVAQNSNHFNSMKDYGTAGPEGFLESFDLSKPIEGALAASNKKMKPTAKRGPFSDRAKRDETAQTRRIGSCIRCRMQRIRCNANPDDAEGACLTCNKSKHKPNSKIWRLPCLRVKITEVKLFKPGQVRGKEWTQRWKDSIVDNITTWGEDAERTILVSEGYTPQRGIQLRVKRFRPQSGDTLHREWASTENPEVQRRIDLPPYAIVDLGEAESQYDEYITECIANYKTFECFVDAVLRARTLPSQQDEHIHLKETYTLAWSLSHETSLSQKERDLLRQALRLWVAIRLTTASTTIVGHETLGIAVMPSDSPQQGKRPVPPVMGAQIDTILRINIQAKWRRDMLEMLQKMTQENKQSTWMTTYLVTFILLHNVALITEHDHNYAVKHSLKRRWAREEQVKEYVFGANVLLAYFHYCNKGVFPFSEACRDQDVRGLADLDEHKFSFVQRTKQWAIHKKGTWDELHRREEYENSYFWVSQLYTHNWMPQIVA